MVLIKPILVYSSILRLRWVFLGGGGIISWGYFPIYRIGLASFVIVAEGKRLTLDLSNERALQLEGAASLGVMLALIRMGGVPPLVGFFAKAIVLNSLLIESQFWLRLIIVALSGGFLFIYFRVRLSLIARARGSLVSSLRKSREVFPLFLILIISSFLWVIFYVGSLR